MGTLITSPEESKSTQGTLFLAGGISNCPDWQKPTAYLLVRHSNLIVFNPRRTGWNMEDSDAESEKQILWEHEHLKRSEKILFWFPKETLCPITLLEFGKYLMSDKELIVGCHPEYQRKLDVEVQGRLERPDMKVWDDLLPMVQSLIV